MDLHKIISLVPGIVYQFRLRPDGSNCIPYASEATREIYRLDPEELREDASKVFIHVHPDDLENHLASIRASARDLTPWQNEYRLKFDDGTVRWLYGNALPQREADGSTLWHGFITDITERKNGEERLRQSEGKLRAYMDNISDTIWLIGANLDMVYVSPSVARLLGFLPDDLIGRPSALVIHPDDMDIVADAQRYVMEHPGDPHTIQYRVSHRDGRWVDVESTGVNLFDNPAVAGVLVTMRDVTERRRIEGELRQTKERYDIATAIGKVGTWDWNPVTDKLLWSDETFRLLGFMVGAVTPSYELFLERVHPADRGFLDHAVRQALYDGKPYILDCRVVVGDGVERTCHVAGKVEFDERGQPARMLGTIQDITDRKRLENALRESEARLRTILDNSPYLVWLKNADGRYLMVNKVYADYARQENADQIVGKSDFDLWPKELAEKYRADDAEIMTSRQQKHTEDPSLDGDRLHWTETFKAPVIDEQGKILGTAGFAHDITERKQYEEALRSSHEAYRNILATSLDGFWLVGPDGRLLEVNERYVEQSGYSREELLGMRIPDLEAAENVAETATHMRLIVTKGSDQFETMHRRKDGSAWHVEVSVIFDPSGSGKFYAFLRDITDRKIAEKKIRNLAFYDTLTGLPNRRLLDDRLRQAITAGKRTGLYGALMFLDLDNFKPLNDAYGHDVGDLLLVEAAQRISSCVREMDTVARFGGDEFVVMLSELDADKTKAAAQAGIVAEKIRIVLAEPYVLKFRRKDGGAEATIEHRCTSSIGVALFSDREAGPEDVLKWADTAMYQAKENGRNRVHFYGS